MKFLPSYGAKTEAASRDPESSTEYEKAINAALGVAETAFETVASLYDYLANRTDKNRLVLFSSLGDAVMYAARLAKCSPVDTDIAQYYDLIETQIHNLRAAGPAVWDDGLTTSAKWIVKITRMSNRSGRFQVDPGLLEAAICRFLVNAFGMCRSLGWEPEALQAGNLGKMESRREHGPDDKREGKILAAHLMGVGHA